jgi:hypothetical protein
MNRAALFATMLQPFYVGDIFCVQEMSGINGKGSDRQFA